MKITGDMMDQKIKQLLDDFFAGYPLRRMNKGEIILRPDETLQHVFYLVEGSVVQYDISAAGNEVVVNAFKPNAFFPMSLAINRTPSNYFFETATPVEMRAAPADDVVVFLKQHPDVLFDLLARVYRGTDGLQRRMAHLMGGNAKSRLIFELINAAYRFGERTDAGMRIPLTENDLAKRSGLSRETVSRTVNKLKVDGLVQVKQSNIVVADVVKLEKLLGSDL
jgi:CRP/FNR family transcriptional regulator, cyclic AMP receptor protein